jgi:tetratricopeptide (TPR) repeat protein
VSNGSMPPLRPPDGMGPSMAQRLRERAAAALDVKRYDEAIEAATAAIASDPGHYRGHGLLAQALLGRKKHVDAQRVAEGGLAVAPDNEWLHRLRSLSLREQGQLVEALKSADESVRLAPNLGYAHYTRALALARMKRIEEARASNRRAVELDPRNADFRRDLGDLFLDKEPKTAEKHYRASLALDPTDPFALNNLGVALKRQGRAREAVVAFKSAMILDPTLGAAKRNTHSTTQEILRTGPSVGLVVLGLLLAWGAREAGEAQLAMLAVALLVGGGGAIVVVAVARRKREDLSKIDPQLFDIFQRLDADKRAGRL